MLSGLHLVVANYGVKIFLVNFKFLFVATLPVFWFLLALSFSRNRARVKSSTTAFLFVFPALTVLMIATNGWHHLVFESSELLVTERFTSVSREYGIWFWMFTAYTYALVLAGVGLFIRSMFRTKGHLRSQALVMSGGSIIPFVFNAVYLTNQDLFYYLDYTPVAFAATGAVYFFGLFKFRMLDLMPIAREEIVRSMEDAVVVTDNNGFIVDTNEATEVLRSSTGRSEVGQSVVAEFPFLKDIWTMSLDNGRHSKEILVELDNFKAWYRADIKAILDRAGNPEGRLIVLRDVSESKAAQIQLQDAKKKAEELSILKSAFLSNMSHDVRSPLAGIIGFAEILTEECEGDQKQFADMIRESGNRLLKLLNSLLSVSHLSSGTLDQQSEVLDLIDLSRRVMAPVEKELIERGIDLKVGFPLEIVEAEHDANHLMHALTHILDYAVKYTEAGEIAFSLAQESEEVVFRIEDTGKGFDPSFVKSISQPLEINNLTEFGLDQGSSLGLRVANGLIEEMGGHLVIQSEIGKGTQFTVRLPAHSSHNGLLTAANRLPISRTTVRDDGAGKLKASA